ncbi:MAG: hypothetical protein EAZ66_06735 [Alphaproteobacteria bacterium]|nr:MAG: hypothetical protein EAZ66_06735 [Alphaproteobacteria bacterium]
MTRPSSLQIYVSRDLARSVRMKSMGQAMSVSEWVRSLIIAACDGDDPAAQTAQTIERIQRHSVFLMVGIDALLAGHPDPDLRDRARAAYARRCKQLGIPSNALDGGTK